MTEKYQEQLCEKHNQRYGAHLNQCPICVGEMMYNPTPPKKDLTKEEIKTMEDKGV